MHRQREDKTITFPLAGKPRAELERHLKRDDSRAILEDELTGLRQDFNRAVRA